MIKEIRDFIGFIGYLSERKRISHLTNPEIYDLTDSDLFNRDVTFFRFTSLFM